MAHPSPRDEGDFFAIDFGLSRDGGYVLFFLLIRFVFGVGDNEEGFALSDSQDGGGVDGGLTWHADDSCGVGS